MLLKLHYRLAHMSFACIQQLAHDGKLPKHIANCKHLVCPACQYGKAYQCPVTHEHTAIDSVQSIPGECVSTDQLESNTPGRIPVMRGKPSTTYYGAATLFIDHASWFLHLNLHTSTGAQEATEAKHRFKKTAKEHGVTISKYRGDNGIYQS